MDQIRFKDVVAAIAIIFLLNKQTQSPLMPTVMDHALTIVNKLANRKVTQAGFAQLLEPNLAVAVHHERRKSLNNLFN
ncbi:unnamed protein product [Eruca vesicaria subsp. sativa]|uniref:Uncharacterized protein n=1 Tax=Eruca vesicaria subsp. sativa TaxID=29727 RepID=A0ABC8LF00_ERUVS|nr:unnamed protein product [Eruca vesicaria subsp. sativa]